MKNIIYVMLRYSGFPWLLREIIYKKRITILCFHNPSPEAADIHYATLKSTYNIITLRKYIDYLSGNSLVKIPHKALIITMDDGFKENYHLLPTLKKHRVPVTIFLCSAIVGTNRHYWWRHVPSGVNGSVLELCSNEERLEKLKAFGFYEDKEYQDRQALSISEIQTLSEYVDFQSHTQFHPALTQCEDDRAETEISGSKQEIENKLDSNVYALAFPNGKYADREITYVKSSGYQSALTTDEGSNKVDSDPYSLKRINIADDVDSNELLVRASGAWGLLKRVFK